MALKFEYSVLKFICNLLFKLWDFLISIPDFNLIHKFIF